MWDKKDQIDVLIGDKWVESDKETIFGPLTGDEKFLVYDKMVTLDVILRDAKLCSRSNAIKNNWNKEIPTGFSQFIYGKKPPKLITVWAPKYQQ